MKKFPPRLPVAILLLAILLPCLGPQAEAQGRPLAAWQDEGSLVLVPAAGKEGARARVEWPDGHVVGMPAEPGGEYSSLTALSSATGSGGAFLATGSRLLEGAESTRRELLLLTGDRGGVRALPLPSLPRDGRHRGGAGAPLFRLGAVPFVDDGALVGLAWLAGDSSRSFAVWAARWLPAGGAAEQGRWGRTELVAPVGPGSQLALQAAVLRDGTWLLVWSAYDGVDNEIVASRRRGVGAAAGWEKPRRVSTDNAVPDITPALVATPDGGAVAVWSRYDGASYRLTRARLEGDAWRDEGWVAPPGSLYPEIVGTPEEPYLLYRAARTRSWEVAALAGAVRDDAAEIVRRGRPATGDGEGEAGDPVLVRNADGSIELRWPGGERP